MKNNNKANTQSLLKFAWFFFKPYTKWVILFISMAIALGLMNPISSYLTKIIIDNLSQFNINHELIKKTIWTLIFLMTIFAANHLYWRILNFIQLKIAPEIKNNIINYLFNYIHNQSYSFFQNNLSGSISHNITILADNIEILFHRYSVQCIRGAVQLTLSLIAMYFVHPIFSLILLIWSIGFISISTIFIKKFKNLSSNYAYIHSNTSGKLVDSIGNFTNVKIFAGDKYEDQYLQKSLIKMKESFRTKEWFLLKVLSMQGFSILCLIGLNWTILFKLKLQNEITIGDFVLISSLLYHVTDNIWWIAEVLSSINESIGKCKQSLSAIFTPIEINDKPQALALKVNRGEIIFDKVHFQYNDNTKFFQNKSIIIKSGQKIGLVGYSGSGKTSFVNLILRLYDIQEGFILIDGQNIQDITQESLHQNIGMIPQDPSLFHRTIMENIRYGRIDATNEEVIEAAKKAHAHEFISKLPQQYESLVGERGIKLSGGQRQRIAIARVILKNAPILIMDEATSALDSVTEHEIQKSLNELMEDKTVIIIAHRLSTLLHMDRILVFDHGMIVEDGKHNKLLMQNGRYKELWDAQINGFLPEKCKNEN